MIAAASSPSPALGNTVTKPELGTKRICAGCNAKFYDLHRSPIVCPMCAAVFVLPKVVPERPRRPIETKSAPVPVVAAPASAVAEVTLVDAEGEEKEAEAGVPLLEEIDED